jgi:hypothetical protein
MVTIEIKNSRLQDMQVQNDADLFYLMLNHFNTDKTILVQADETDLSEAEKLACAEYEKGEKTFVDV